MELLEPRCVLSVTVNQSGGILTITGTNRADQIVVTDIGSKVAVYSGKMHFLKQASGVTQIVVNAGSGNDHVQYDVQGVSDSQVDSSGNAVDHKLTVNLGSGNDHFAMNVLAGVPTAAVSLGNGDRISNLAAQSDLAIQVTGGSGNDATSLRALSVGSNATLDCTFQGGQGHSRFDALLGNNGNSLHAGSTVDLTFLAGAEGSQASVVANEDLASGAHLTLNLGGGKGKDQDSVQYSGQDKGTLSLQENGGAGDDTLSGSVNLSAGSSGRVTANDDGEDGDDDLTLAVRKASSSDNPTLDANVDGGAGTDTCAATSNVHSKNCEKSSTIT